MFFISIFFIVISACWSATNAGKRLFSNGGSSDTYLVSNWNKYDENYHPNYAFDDNSATAWVEGLEGQGEGAQLNWKVSRLDSADKVILKIRNGYQKSKKLFKANSSAKEVKITVLGKTGKVAKTISTELKQKLGWQDIEIPLERNLGLSGFLLEIKSVYPGTTYKDTCLSDIQTWVQSEIPYDEPAEKGKEKELAEWIKARLRTANYFANLPKDYPFVATGFEGKVQSFEAPCSYSKDNKDCPYRSLIETLENSRKLEFVPHDLLPKIKEAQALFNKVLKDSLYWKISLTKEALARSAPDFYIKDNYINHLWKPLTQSVRVSDFNIFEATKLVAKIESQYGVQSIFSNAKIQFQKNQNDKNIPQVIVTWHKRAYSERSYYEYLSYTGKIYYQNGNLKQLIVWAPKSEKFGNQKFSESPDSWQLDESFGKSFSFIEPEYDKNGRIAKLQFFRFSSDDEFEGVTEVEHYTLDPLPKKSETHL